MKHKTKLSVIPTIAVILSLMIFVSTVAVTIPPAKAQFVIAWTYDSESGNGFSYDEYGQGLFEYTLWENVTNAPNWNAVGGVYYFNETASHEWEVGYGIRLDLYVWMNSTLTDASDLADGLNYIRLNVTVVGYGVEVYSETNITNFYSSSYFDAEMWLYGYTVEPDFLPLAGIAYTATITYEVYW